MYFIDLKLFTTNQFVKIKTEIACIQQGNPPIEEQKLESDDLNKLLPLKCVDDLTQFETWLESDDHKDSAVSLNKFEVEYIHK